MKTCYVCGYTKKESDYLDFRNTCKKCTSNQVSARYRIKAESAIEDRITRTRKALSEIDGFLLSGDIPSAIEAIKRFKREGLYANTLESSKYDRVNNQRHRLEVMQLATEQMAERMNNVGR